MHEEACVVANIVMHQKDHKPVDAESGLPKKHPVYGASSTHNQRVSDLLSDILAATFESEESLEAISTEDMLAKIDEFNRKVEAEEISPRNPIIGSLDVESLYPSVDTKLAAKICRDRIQNSPLNIEQG